jgi:hypothetical protein
MGFLFTNPKKFCRIKVARKQISLVAPLWSLKEFAPGTNKSQIQNLQKFLASLHD